MSTLKRKPTRSALLVLIFLATVTAVHAQKGDDLDAYKWRVDGSWWFSNPTGSIHGANSSGSFDLNKDFGFGSYSTFAGNVDWHFKRKQHLVLRVAPVNSERTRTLTDQIEFEGVTYDVGAQVTAQIRSLAFAPGYQYDFIRRDHGYFAGAVLLYLVDTKGSLSGIGTANGVTASRTASGSVFAPLPTIGVQGRWYPMHDSDRIALDGYGDGMYFFGYGDFFSARGQVAVKVHSHLGITAGYELGTDLSIHGNTNRIGVRLTQKGPVVGLQGTW